MTIFSIWYCLSSPFVEWMACFFCSFFSLVSLFNWHQFDLLCFFLHSVHTGILDWSRVPRLVYSSLPFPRQGAHCSFHTSLAAIFAMFTMMIMHGTGCLVNWWGGLYLFSIVRRRGFSEMWWRAWFWLGAWRDANKCMILLFFVFPFTSFILVILGLFAVQLFYSFVWSK